MRCGPIRPRREGQMTIKKTLAIARWEFIEKVRTKAFIISLIITPLFIILVSVVPTLLMSKGDSSTVDIGLIDYTGEITQRLNEDLLEKYKLPDGKPNYEIVSIPADDSARAIGNRLVLDGKISSYVVVDTSIRSTRTFGYVSQNVSNFNQLERIRSSMKDIIVSSELEQSGVGTGIIKEITKPVNYETVQLSKTGQEEKARWATCSLWSSHYSSSPQDSCSSGASSKRNRTGSSRYSSRLQLLMK